MSELLPFLLVGLAAGSLYGLAATGLVLTYRTSGILNFAHGALAAVAVYVFYFLWITTGLPWWVGAVVAVLVVGPLMGLLLERMAARLARADSVQQVVATIGIILLVQALCHLWYGNEFLPFPQYLPVDSIQVGGVFVTTAQVIVMAISVVCAAVLFGILRFTRIGVLMRAVVDSPELLDLTGVNPASIRRSAWMIGSTFAALSGVLLAPTISLDVTVLIFLVVQSFGAAAIGRFSSLPLTYLGGLVLGVASAVATKYVGDVTWLAGLPASVPFIVLFVALLVTPRRFLQQARRAGRQSFDRWRAPARFQAMLFAAIVVVLAFVPALFPNTLVGWTSALAFAIVFLSLGMLVKSARQVSLAHLVFVGIGAAALSHLTVDLGLPWLPSLLIAGLVAVPVGVLVALPASRLPGVFLALATLAMGITFDQMLYAQPWFFGGGSDGISVPRPVLGGLDLTSDAAFYYAVLVVLVVVFVLVTLVLRSRLGRLLTAMGDAPTALRTHGADLVTIRVLVFCLSAFLAGVAGGLLGNTVGVIGPTSFTTYASLLVLALLMAQRGGELFYPIVAGIVLQVVGVYLQLSDDVLSLLFGLTALFVALTPNAEDSQVPHRLRRTIERVFAPARPAAIPAPRGEGPVRPVVEGGGIVIQNLTVAYGGAVAVDDLSLAARPGRITGLIGPNGAGKSTTFNACSGLLQPRRGVVELCGEDVSRVSADGRARRGLGRTFQRMELFDTMTVADNIRVGAEAGLAGRNPLRNVVARRRDAAEVAAVVEEAVELCGLGSLRTRAAGSLSTGQRRIVELARVLAGNFSVLLLDEPSSGLDVTESAQFGDILRRAVALRRLTVLMVEHDMSLVMGVCNYIYVLDFGALIFQGTPAEVAGSPLVRAAYLGESGSEDLDEVALTTATAVSAAAD